MRRILSLLLTAFCIVLYAKDIPREDVVTLAFVGDIMTHDSQIHGAQIGDGYDFSPCFARVAPILRRADIAVGNLETPCAQLPPSGYPAFNAPVELLDALRDAGFGVLNLANNHACDQRAAGLEQTIAAIEARGLRHTGVHGRQPCVVEANGLRVWVSAYTYGSNRDSGGHTFPAYIKPERIRNDLATSDADVRIVMLHWGAEYHRKPSASQIALADSILAWGAHAVIGGHPHVIQPARRDTRGFVAFSLGNFVSGQREGNPGVRWTEDGVILQLTFARGKGGVRLVSVDAEPSWVYRQKGDDGYWDYEVVPTRAAGTFADAAIRERIRLSQEDTSSILHAPIGGDEVQE